MKASLLRLYIKTLRLRRYASFPSQLRYRRSKWLRLRAVK